MEKYKVVIVGAGIAGMSAAINLKRAGINPLIIENNAPGGTLNYHYNSLLKLIFYFFVVFSPA